MATVLCIDDESHIVKNGQARVERKQRFAIWFTRKRHIHKAALDFNRPVVNSNQVFLTLIKESPTRTVVPGHSDEDIIERR
jgi:hypothetical protein